MSDMADIEKTLIDRARNGDRAACGELVRRHQDFIYNSIVYMTGDAGPQADDLSQSVFLKALENLKSFEGRCRFSTWLYSITINTVRTFWRDEKYKNNPTSLDTVPGGVENGQPLSSRLASKETDPWEALIAKENINTVRAAISTLSDEFREIVVLRDIQGLSYKRLAAVLGIAPGTVKSRLARARGALKQELERQMKGGSQ